MKKLLLVLVVVTLASFLLVGCLNGGTTPPPDDDDDDVVVQAVAIAIEDQYPATAKEYIRADLLDVTVTFAVAVGEDDLVRFVAKEAGAPALTAKTGAEVTLTEVAGSGRKVWKFVDYDFNNTGVDPLGLGDLADCVEICLYVTVNDCCVPDPTPDIYYEIVKLDDTPPDVTPYLTFKDCNPCVEVLPCDDPVLGGAYFEFTTLTTDQDPCDPLLGNLCADACSGVGAWSFTVDKASLCDACPSASGTGCTVVGAADCGCLPYVDPDDWESVEDNIHYTITFDVKDNVGNAQAPMTWELEVDTDSIVTT